jgi:signal transduction histidine kinase
LTGCVGHERRLEAWAQPERRARAARALETAEEIACALAGEIDLPRVLELIVTRARTLLCARVMVVALIEDDVLVIRAVAGDADGLHLGSELPIAGTLAGDAVASGEARRLSDLRPGLAASLPPLFGARSALIVPLRLRGRGVGVLAAFDRLSGGPEFDAEDERLMRAFAANAASAVATAREAAAEIVERSLAAAEAERTGWARELHDGTLQDLAGINLLLGHAGKLRDPAEQQQLVAEATEHLQATIARLRALIADLRPAALDELGVGAALTALAVRVTAEADLEMALDLDLAYEGGRAGSRHRAELETTLYRLVQEALRNVARHAGARRVELRVHEDDRTIHVRVHDDGQGFDPARSGQGFGLLGMRELVTLAKGTLQVTSSAGGGTTIHATLPARRRSAAATP